LASTGVDGSGTAARPGAQTLVLLSSPRNCLVLQTLADGPQRQVEQPGHELLFVMACLGRWLAGAPDGPLELGSEPAKAAVKAFVEGWSSNMLRALASRPLSLTELDRIITDLNYPSLERRLAAMRLAGQLEAARSNGRGTPYAATDWLRHSVAPLAAAARWERRNLPAEAAGIGRIDVEAGFLLTVPLLQMPDTSSGICRLVVELPTRGDNRLAGVTISLENGHILSCTTRLQGTAAAWAAGSPMAWFRAVIEGDLDQLEVGGDCQLARTLFSGLHDVLFGSGSPRVPKTANIRSGLGT
jgi:DNA-binding HxlR family transcriptional regulator